MTGRIPRLRPSTARGTFAAAVGIMAVAWYLGISQVSPLASVNIDYVRVSGIRNTVTGGVEDYFGLLFVLALISAAYLLALLALRTEFRHSFWFALGGSAVAAAAVLPAMPLTSPDTMHFAADVRTLWFEHEYPTLSSGVPSKQDDPVAQAVVSYRSAPSGYGPLAYIMGGAALPFVGDNIRANVFGIKVISAIALLATAAGSGVLARRLGRNAALATGLVGLNPLFLWQFPGDGHNDSIMSAFAIWALVLLVHVSVRRRAVGVALALAAVLVKFALVAAAPIILASWLKPGQRLLFASAISVVGTVVVMLYFSGLDPGTGTSGPINGVTRNTPWDWIIPNDNDNVRKILLAFCYSSAVAMIALIVSRHRFDTPQDLVDAVALGMAIFIFCFAPTLRYWYQVWALPAVAVTSRPWLKAAGLTFTVGAFLPLLTQNWDLTIDRELGIEQPLAVAVALLWGGTVAAGLVVWRMRPAEPRPSRANRRREPALPGRQGARSRLRRQAARPARS